ncbi:MAG: four-carbon acid sugar kinase family protein, partial [Armatimonadota bacterium]|nr:four-carbon acid sugar kinase family protein [Armatimonadota bacterium]
MRWGIVADDLTGAADAAAPFATAGLRTCVVLEPVVLPKRYDCIALDAEARWRTADEAAERIASFVAKLRDADGLMLKVDSTLRGFVGAMVKAAWQASRRHWALFAPAVPTQGRLVRDGQLFV